MGPSSSSHDQQVPANLLAAEVHDPFPLRELALLASAMEVLLAPGPDPPPRDYPAVARRFFPSLLATGFPSSPATDFVLVEARKVILAVGRCESGTVYCCCRARPIRPSLQASDGYFAFKVA